MKSFRILHVDDDPLMRDVVALALGFDSEFAVSSRTAKLARSFLPRPLGS